MTRNMNMCGLLAVGVICLGTVAQAADKQATADKNIELVSTLAAKGEYVSLQGKSLFVTNQGKKSDEKENAGFWLDIGKDPAKPELVNSALPPAWDIAVAGNHAFVCDYTPYLSVYEIKDRQWVLVTRLRMPSNTENILIRGSLAYIANHTAGLAIVDISTPDKPAIVGKLNPKVDCDAIGLWKDCAILYGHWESRLVMVDISDPKNPRQTGVYQHDDKTFIQGEMDVDRGFAYCTAGKNNLVIVNVANPAKPELVKVVELKHASDVIARDGYAFVAGSGGVVVLDVRDPAKPTEVGSYKCKAFQLTVERAASGYYIYVARKDDPAIVLRFTTPHGDDRALKHDRSAAGSKPD